MWDGYALLFPDLRALEEGVGYRAAFAFPWKAAPRLAPGQYAPVILSDRKLYLMRFGLVPPWAPSPQVGRKTPTVRGENLLEKKAYARALTERRCLVPLSDPRGHVTFAAGLWELWGRGERDLQSFAVITHKNQPLLLTPSSEQVLWLDPNVQGVAALGGLSVELAAGRKLRSK